jgi:fused signal recognition particle receptor
MINFWSKNKKDAEQENKTEGVFVKLKDSLSVTSSKISSGINDIFTKRKLDDETLEELEDLLISSDLGTATSAKIVEALSADKFNKDIDAEGVKEALAEEIEKILAPVEKRLCIEDDKKPFVILMVGVNGTGKTTAIGKLAYKMQQNGKKIMFAAGDTFRAAAVAQLKSWADRLNIPVIEKEEGADPAALVYEAMDKALNSDTDVLFIDTAGRLQNKQGLMEELKKIDRVIKKKMPDAPHETIIVLDATVGQNAHSQVDLFAKAVDLSGMIITKLDGTAKGGVVVSLAEKFGYPLYSIGTGEKIEDLRDFNAKDFAKILAGL